MKQGIIKYWIFNLCRVLISILILTSCDFSREWTDHYSSSVDMNSTVLDMIRNQPEYSLFYEKLVTTGYDSLLEKDQYFTVFVPVNSSFENLPDYSAAEWEKIIGFHICYASLHSKDFSDMKIRSSIGKLLYFHRYTEDSVFIFNSKINLENADQNCRNGVIHELGNILIPRENIYEYIKALGPEYSLLNKYLNSMDKIYIDLQKSTRIGVDAEGNTIYDTVWAWNNSFIDHVAMINSESESYTALLIRDADVNSAILSASGYFGDISLLDDHTFTQILSIVYSAAFFNGIYKQSELPDSLTSVTGKSLLLSDLHFSSEADMEMSNGIIHVLDGFNIPNEFFLLPIVVEGDDKSRRRVSNTVYTTTVKSDSRASNGTYFQYASKSIGDYVEYSVDMVLATKYWIVWTSPALGGSLYQLSVDGVNLGDPVDNYYKGNFKPVVSGSIVFDQFGTKTIRMTVVGQSIPGYNSIYLDYFKLIPDELYIP